MILGKTRRTGRMIEDISVGEKLKLTEKIEDKDLLLYLGLTNDSNPLYIQHDFAARTSYEKPIVPSIMLTGIVTSAASKYLPGPGSHVVEQHLQFPFPVYHYEVIDFLFEVSEINIQDHTITISVKAKNNDDRTVISGTILVKPPVSEEKMLLEPVENI